MNRIFKLATLAFTITNMYLIKPSDISFQLPSKVIASDCDGCIQEDVKPWKQFFNVMHVLPFKVIVYGFFQNLGTIKDMALYGLHDEHGNKLVSHDSYVHYFADRSPALRPHYTAIIHALSRGKPMIETIKKLQQEQKSGTPVFIWANRGPDSLKATLDYINTNLDMAEIDPFIPDGCFSVGNQGIHTSPVAKPNIEYYQKAFEYVREVLVKKGFDVNAIERIDFIDDKQAYVIAFKKWGSTVPHIHTVAIQHSQIDEQFLSIYTAACDKSVADNSI